MDGSVEDQGETLEEFAKRMVAQQATLRNDPLTEIEMIATAATAQQTLIDAVQGMYEVKTQGISEEARLLVYGALTMLEKSFLAMHESDSSVDVAKHCATQAMLLQAIYIKGLLDGKKGIDIDVK